MAEGGSRFSEKARNRGEWSTRSVHAVDRIIVLKDRLFTSACYYLPTYIYYYYYYLLWRITQRQWFAFCLFHAGFWKLEQLCLPRPQNLQLTSNQVQGSIMMNQARLPSFHHCKVHRQYRFVADYVWCKVCSMYLYYWLAYIVLMWAESNRLCCMAVYLHVIDVHIAHSYWIAFCCTGLLRPTANRL